MDQSDRLLQKGPCEASFVVRKFAEQSEAQRDIFAFIEGFYNPASEHPSGYVIEEKRLC